MVRQAPGQGDAMARTPSARWPGAQGTSAPVCASTTFGSTPKKGRQQEPGFMGVTPGRGVMMWPPVSVCQYVSAMAHRESPTTSKYQRQASGLMGSPTLPKMRSEDRSCFFTGASP